MRKSPSILVIAILVASLCSAVFAETVPGVVNINTADTAQLTFLPRVGAKAAQSIVDYRTQHGPFKTTTDLMQVKGFGDKRFAKLSPYITVEGKTTLSSKVSAAKKPHAKAPAPTASK